ncbi:hypothetical protein [Limisphaera sp. VF-2]|uniref:hypothetical protein n=1 Tax=Limisphaera sp. VF-2 TaxID=3400418 RepID=UPI00175304F9
MNLLPMETPLSPSGPVAGTEAPAHVLRLFGVGTAGMRLLLPLAARRPGSPAAFVVLPAWDPIPTELPDGVRCLRLERTTQLPWSATGDPDGARAMAEENYGRLREVCAGAEWVLVLAGLGGGSGSGMAPVLARAAREAGARTLVLAVTPFHWEGSFRLQQAHAALEELRAVADGLVCLPNQKLFGLLPQPTPVVETYARVNEWLHQGLEAFLDLLTHRGLLPLPLDKLCALLRGRHAESVLVTARAEGTGRLVTLNQELLQHPLLEEGQALLAATSVVLHVTGGPDLSVGDVDGLVQLLQTRCGHAELLVGAAVRPEWSGRLRALLLVTRRGDRLARTASGSFGHAAVVEGTREAERGRSASGSADHVNGKTAGQTPSGSAGLEDGAAGLRRDVASRVTFPRRTAPARMRQGTLPLDVPPRGRFERTQPNIHRGEDLDIPTYIRRGIVLE